jgi:tripartite-type tricarboxylate transporter receptor subunit TctC
VNAALENSKLDVPKLPFSLVKDFTPISQLTGNSYVLVISSKHPVRTVAELVALAKANPGKLTYGSSGTGGIIHLAGEWLAAATKTKMTHVPHKSNAMAMNDVAGAHIDMMFSSVALMNTVVSSGKGRGIAVTSAARMAAAPDIPTFIEAGVPGFEIDGWYGIVGPPAMPANIVNKLSAEMARAVKLPEVGTKLATDGAIGVGSTPAQFAALLQSEDKKWRQVVKDIGFAK